MNKSLKTWLILVLFTFFGIFLKYVSEYTYKKELILQKGQIVNLRILRLTPSNLGFSIAFKEGTNGLGDAILKNSDTHNRDGYLFYKNPGEPIILSVENTKQNRYYEAKPSFLDGRNDIERFMFPYENDNNPNKFSYPKSKSEAFSLSIGFNNIQIKVEDVGKELDGEKVILKISPAMPDFKFISTVPLYNFLWYFNLWPLFFLVLFISYKKIKKNLDGDVFIKANFINMFDYLIYYILLVPSSYFFVFLFSNSFVGAFLVAFLINLITIPFFLQKKYPLNDNAHKITVWSIWLITSVILLYITFNYYTIFGRWK